MHPRRIAGAAAVATLLLGAAAGPVRAQEVSADMPAALAGRWEGAGTILGQPARVTLEWVPVLDDRFARLTWVSHIGPQAAGRRFEGHAYYQATGDGFRATWFDSSGMVRPITATRTADTIVARWGTADTEQGETTYRVTGRGELLVVDRVLGTDGAWREFGRSTLRRVP
jgi:hypothetical protein